MNLRSIAIALAASTALAACGMPPHTTLTPPPSRAAPAADRLQVFERYRPAATSSTTIIRSGVAVEQHTDFLVLADGTRIYHAEDLAGAVFPDSATARAAERSRNNFRRARIMSGIGWGAFAVGIGIATVAMVSADDPGEIESRTTSLTIGLGLALAGGALWAVAVLPGRDGYDERVSAFTTYEADLRTRLDLCVRKTEIVDCRVASEQGTAGDQAAAPAAY